PHPEQDRIEGEECVPLRHEPRGRLHRGARRRASQTNDHHGAIRQNSAYGGLGLMPRSRPAERRAARSARPRRAEPTRAAGPRPASRSISWTAALSHPATWCALAAALAYLPSLRFGLVWDDHRLIEQNPLLRSVPGV